MSFTPRSPDSLDATETKRWRSGQVISCRVTAREPGGYAVTLVVDELPGFLPTETHLKIGSELMAEFVCIHQGRVLVSNRHSDSELTSYPKYRTPTVQWSESSNVETPREPPPVGDSTEENPALQMLWSHATFYNKQASQDSRPDFRRLTDILVPPFDGFFQETINISDTDPAILITQLESSQRTCCIRSTSAELNCRAGLLMYRGRATGSVYTESKYLESPPTEEALRLQIGSWRNSDAILHIYDLPEAVVLAQSALFFGHPVERTDNLQARDYVQYILAWMELNSQTGCLALASARINDSLLIYMHQGKFVGAFMADEQQYFEDFLVVDVFTKNEPHAEISVTILPPEALSSAVCIGYSLSKIAHELG